MLVEYVDISLYSKEFDHNYCKYYIISGRKIGYDAREMLERLLNNNHIVVQ